MGRDYIAERTIADPRERAAEKARRAAAARRRKAAEAKSLAAYLERSRRCAHKGCNALASTGDGGWAPCCSQACHRAWLVELERQEERKQARRQGIPVATYRAQRAQARQTPSTDVDVKHLT